MAKLYSSRALMKMAGGGGMHPPHSSLDPPLLSGTARRLQILRYGFDSQLEPLACEIYIGCPQTQKVQVILKSFVIC